LPQSIQYYLNYTREAVHMRDLQSHGTIIEVVSSGFNENWGDESKVAEHLGSRVIRREMGKAGRDTYSVHARISECNNLVFRRYLACAVFTHISCSDSFVISDTIFGALDHGTSSACTSLMK